MFQALYSFFYDWLFAGGVPTFLSAQGAEFTTILFSVVCLFALIAIAITPIKILIRWICGG